MQLIKNRTFGGERPLFAAHDVHLDNVTIQAGESAIKECRNIVATHCRFEGNYPFWHVHASASATATLTWAAAPPCGILTTCKCQTPGLTPPKCSAR